MENQAVINLRRQADRLVLRLQGLFLPSLATTIASFALLLTGLGSQVFLGDEVHHYRFAKDTFLTGHRALFDSVYGIPTPPGFLYTSDPAWSLGLAGLWKLLGHISFPIAQIYHTLFFVLLLGSVCALGRHLYGPREGFWALLITSAVPMMASFGILFYTEIPALALAATSLFLLLRRRYFWAGVFLGVALLTKRSMAFFIPAFALIFVIQNRKSFWAFLRGGVFYAVPPVLFVLSDILWRHFRLYAPSNVPAQAGESIAGAAQTSWTSQLVQDTYLIFVQRFGPFLSGLQKLTEPQEFTNSFLLNPVDAGKYFGIVLPVLLGIYLVRRSWDRRDWVIGLSLASFAVCFLMMFRLGTDVRYLLPITPFLALLAGKALSGITHRFVLAFVILGCVAQFFATVGYVYHERRPTPAVQEGFEYVKAHLPDKALVMYPETNFTEYTNRPMIWTLGPAFHLMWASDADAQALIQHYGIDYILAKKTRVYDDSKTRLKHTGGFAKSFMEKLGRIPYLEGPVFENAELSLWKTKSP